MLFKWQLLFFSVISEGVKQKTGFFFFAAERIEAPSTEMRQAIVGVIFMGGVWTF